MFLWVLFSVLVSIIVILISKIISMKRNITIVQSQLSEYLQTDTNTLITTSSNDKTIQYLANALNKELRLLRKQRLKYLNGDRELKEAVTNIAHDLRTPLTAICGYLDLLESEERSEDVCRYIALIKNRTESLKQLTEEMFRYSVIMSTVDI